MDRFGSPFCEQEATAISNESGDPKNLGRLANNKLPGLVNIQKTDGKITMCFMGKSTISTGPCSIANCNSLPEAISY